MANNLQMKNLNDSKRTSPKIYVLLPSKIDKYEYLTGKEIFVYNKTEQ